MVDRDDMQAMANEVRDRYGIDSIAIPSKLYETFDCTDPYLEARDGPYVTLDLSNIENIQCKHDHHRLAYGFDIEIDGSLHQCSHRCLYPIAREISLWYQSDPFHPPIDDPDCIRNLVDMCAVDTELSCVQPESDQVLALACSKDCVGMSVL